MELFQQNVKAALDRLSAIRIVPVLVLDNLEDGLKMCSVLQEKQLPAAEITFPSAVVTSTVCPREDADRIREQGTVTGTRETRRVISGSSPVRARSASSSTRLRSSVEQGFTR